MARERSNSAEEIRRLQRFKGGTAAGASPLGEEMIDFFKRSIVKRQTKLSKVAEFWGILVPETLNDHCALEGFSKGVLTVIVDSSSHLYELKQLLLAGIQQQLLLACRGAGLRKIVLKPGRWYEGDGPGDRRIVFADGK